MRLRRHLRAKALRSNSVLERNRGRIIAHQQGDEFQDALLAQDLLLFAFKRRLEPENRRFRDRRTAARGNRMSGVEPLRPAPSGRLMRR
jgi:hypothetical protein